MKEIVDAIGTRIQAPYFGYAVLAFIALNWRALFMLLMHNAPVPDRIAAFEQGTTLWSVLLFPLLIGAFFAVLTPWSRFIFESISQKPLALRDRLRIHAEHERTVLQSELEKARTELFGQKEKELIARAKRDEEIAAIDDGELKQRLEKEVAALRTERDELKSQVGTATVSAASPDKLSGAAVEMVKAAASMESGDILTPKTLSGRSIQAGNETFGQEDAKSYARYASALEELEQQGYIKAVGNKREIFELTHKGWSFAE
jgi:hypothetical protein